MAEYIERNTLIAWFENMHGTRNIIKAIQNKKRFPSADVVEVKYGEWVKKGIASVCSVCSAEIVIEQGTTELNYCPNCGAKMKGGV